MESALDNHFLSTFFEISNNNNNNGLLKYTRWHKNYELQCAYMIQEIKLHLFRRDWDYRLFINYLQFGYG